MKRSTSFLASLFVITCTLASSIFAAGSSREILSKEAPNASAWALAGLDETVPPDIRRNLTYLGEDLLDEGKAAPQASAASYKLGSDLCNYLIAALDERNRACVRAGYRAAQADANTKVTSPDLEIRGSVLYRWPQYAREQNQRSEIQRQQNNQTSLAKQQVLVEWADRVEILRRNLDVLYKRYREALRQDQTFQKGNQNFNSATPAPVKPPEPVKAPAPSPVAPAAIEIPANVKELFTAEFRALPDKERLKRIAAKLSELNPGYAERFFKPTKNGRLGFRGLPVANLWPLRAMTGITELECNRSVYDLSPLAGMSSLQVLKIYQSRVTDLSPLTGLRLTTLYAHYTRIADLRPLTGMPLQTLGIKHTHIADLTPLAGMPLEKLGCANTRVKDLSPLKTMKNLRTLTCDFVPARDIEILRSIKTLETINGLPVAEFWNQVAAGKAPQPGEETADDDNS